ncbi:hypothetical protein V5F53_02210 [Xanthobacter sp. V4C-4]|uniref:hypothetical protein n=1 Tax=Xanthobacter cornucopiae TaxID=3119924 RepID=UPI0037290EF1
MSALPASFGRGVALGRTRGMIRGAPVCLTAGFRSFGHPWFSTFVVVGFPVLNASHFLNDPTKYIDL